MGDAKDRKDKPAPEVTGRSAPAGDGLGHRDEADARRDSTAAGQPVGDRQPVIGDWVRVFVQPTRNGGVDEAPAIVTAVGRSNEAGGDQVRVNVRVFADGTDVVKPVTGLPLYRSRRDAEQAPVAVDRRHAAWWPEG